MVPEDFKIYYKSLSESDQKQLIKELLDFNVSDQDLEVNISSPLNCVHCKSDQIVGYGKNKTGVQRYKCKSCNRTFSATSGKVWYHMHKKEKLTSYMHCLLSGYSIRESGTRVGISLATSFSWRHKLLTSFASVHSQEFSGIVESDETYFLYSEKGKKDLDRPSRKRGNTANRDGINDEHVAVIVTMDRKGNKAMKVSKRGRITTQDVLDQLKGKISKESIICTDGHPSYTGFAKREKLNHKQIIASKGQRVIEKHYHVQNVNSLDSRLKKFINTFNGVSTKYLQNYLNWFLALEKVKNNTQRLKSLHTLAFSSTLAWYEYIHLINNNFI